MASTQPPAVPTCRWPFGDPRTDDFKWCGAPAVDGTYCEEHRPKATDPGRYAAGVDLDELARRFPRPDQ